MINDQNYQPLTFKKVTVPEAQLANLLSTRNVQFQVPLGGKDCFIALTHTSSTRHPEFQMEVDLGGRCFRIFFGKALLNELLPGKLDHNIIQKLPSDLMKAAIEHSFSDLKAILQQNSGLSIVLSQFKKSQPLKEPSLDVDLSIGQIKTIIQVEINDVITQLLMSISPQQNPNFPDIPFKLPLQKGQTTLSYQELTGITVGDLIFLEQHAGSSEIMVRINQSTTYLGSHQESRVTILRRLEAMNELTGTEDHFDDDDEFGTLPEFSDTEHSEDAGIDLDDLPVHLTFDVGEQQMSAAEVLAIKTGFIFQLDNPVQQPLKIRANGKLIGKGELVEVDGRLAARITELNQ